MLSKNQIKFIRSLHQKKFRTAHQLFLVEGEKNVLETLQANHPIADLYVTKKFHQKYADLLDSQKHSYIIVSQEQLNQAGTLSTNEAALLLAPIRAAMPKSLEVGEYALMLDDIRDPGNLGTILRIADWYGIKQIIASPLCVDLYNPKVISSSKGSYLRVHYVVNSLREILESAQSQHLATLGTFPDGDNIHHFSFSSKGGYIVLGNESQGINSSLMPYFDHRLSIPRFGQAESLNVAMACAIICDNLRRQLSD